MTNMTTTVVIAIGLILAAVIVTRTPAQQEYGGEGACCYGANGCTTNGGGQNQCLANGGLWLGTGTTCAECPPPPGPTVVGVSVFVGAQNSQVIYRAWSDGQVDRHLVRFSTTVGSLCDLIDSCGPNIIVTGTCPTDINRDGDTGIIDFLTLLGGWGACR